MVGFYVTLGLGAVWLVVALLTTRHRTLHDLVSGLVVVRAARAIDAAIDAARAVWNMRSGGSPHA